jgi:DNA-binding HxlR family transcriptional regulator
MVAKHSAASRRTREDKGAHPVSPQPLRSVKGGEAANPDASNEGALALDRLIHERLRLGIVSALAVNEALTFNELKRLMQTTDGNLSVHARKLEDAGYVTCTKSFEGRMPKTEYRLTSPGRRALERYLDHMEALIRATRER